MKHATNPAMDATIGAKGKLADMHDRLTDARHLDARTNVSTRGIGASIARSGLTTLAMIDAIAGTIDPITG